MWIKAAVLHNPLLERMAIIGRKADPIRLSLESLLVLIIQNTRDPGADRKSIALFGNGPDGMILLECDLGSRVDYLIGICPRIMRSRRSLRRWGL